MSTGTRQAAFLAFSLGDQNGYDPLTDRAEHVGVVSTEGAVLGALEKRPEGFVIVPSMATPLADLDTPPFASLEAARAGIAAHCQGTCEIGDAL